MSLVPKIAKYLLIFTLCLFSTNLFAQYTITYDNIPMSWQLYARDSLNKAIVPVKGKFSTLGYDNISLVLTREDKVGAYIYYKKTPLTYTNGSADFSFSTTIQAGLYNYTYQIFAYKGKDSVLVDVRSKITCGDVILIYGQSNALAFANIDAYPYANDFCRVIYVDNFASRKFSWNYQIWQTAIHIGSFGAEVAKLITTKYKIPVCILNAAVGSTSIFDLSDRDKNNPLNPLTNYGHFLAYADFGEVAKKAKILLWRQGEYEASEQSGTLAGLYPAHFDTLYKYLKTDFPALKKIYSFQNNIYGNPNPNGGALRDFQRRQALIYKDIQAISTVGTVTFDGLHYSVPGYIQSANEVFRQISRDFYGETNTENFDSPYIQKAFYNASKNVVTLVFDDKQNLVQVPQDSVVGDPKSPIKIWRLQDFIYLDGKTDKNDKILMDGNRCTLYLTDSSNAKKISYLPSYFSDYVVTHTYDGLHIKNSLGMRALSFEDITIAPLMKINNIKTILTDNVSVNLQWDKLTETSPVVIIERSKIGLDNFTKIATLQAGETSYLDKNLIPETTYNYRLKALSASSESDYSAVFSIKTKELITALESETNKNSLLIYPNPTGINKFYVNQDLQYKSLIIKDLSGKMLAKFENNQKEIDISGMTAGVLLIEIKDNENNIIVKKLIKQ